MTILPLRSFTTACLVALITALGILASTEAHAEWQDRTSDLGGWLDTDTGLVWGTESISYAGTYSWTGAQTLFLPALRQATGISHWRLPSISEMQVMVENGGAPVLTDYSGTLAWSSNQYDKKKAYAARPRLKPDGTIITSIVTKTGYCNVFPVYSIYDLP